MLNLVLALACLAPLGDTQGSSTSAPDPKRPNCLRLIEPDNGPVHAVDLSSDGARILIGCSNGHALVFERNSGKLLKDLFLEPGPVWDVEFDPTGKHFLVTQSGVTSVWNADTFESVRQLRGQKLGMFNGTFSPDGMRVATGSIGNPLGPTVDAEARVWNLAVEDPIAIVPGLGYRVQVAFRNDGQALLVGSETTNDATIVLLGEKVTTRTLTGSPVGFAATAWSPDGKLVLGVGADNMGRLWDAESGRVLHVLSGHTGYMMRCGFRPDGKEVSTTSWVDRTTRIWNVKTGKERLVLEGHKDRPTVARFTPDGLTFVSADATGLVLLFELDRGEVAAKLEGHTGIVGGLAISKDSKFVVTGSYDGTVRVWRNPRAR